VSFDCRFQLFRVSIPIAGMLIEDDPICGNRFAGVHIPMSLVLFCTGNALIPALMHHRRSVWTDRAPGPVV
jgi:hypothetical protein